MRISHVHRRGQITLDAVITGCVLLFVTGTAYLLFLGIVRDYLTTLAAGSLPAF